MLRVAQLAQLLPKFSHVWAKFVLASHHLMNVTSMKNRHINPNIDEANCPAARLGASRPERTARHAARIHALSFIYHKLITPPISNLLSVNNSLHIQSGSVGNFVVLSLHPRAASGGKWFRSIPRPKPWLFLLHKSYKESI